MPLVFTALAMMVIERPKDGAGERLRCLFARVSPFILCAAMVARRCVVVLAFFPETERGSLAAIETAP